jgi:predicted transcriptional regulator
LGKKETRETNLYLKPAIVKPDKPKDRFFIYRHLRNDTGKPFYIGKGAHHLQGGSNEVFYGRAYSLKGRTKRWLRIVNKHGHTVEILSDNLTLQEAKAKEVEFISLYGKVSDGGILVNFKNGGEDDVTDYKHSQETIDKFTRTQRKSVQWNMDNNISFEPNTGCWLWCGQFSDGFPKINVNSRTLQATRTIYQHVKNIKLKPKSEVLHNQCNCEHCVNPDHYKVGPACPINKQSRKLTKDQVIQIKNLAVTTNLNQKEIADLLGITDSSVNSILTGRSWKWLKVEGCPETIKSSYHSKLCRKVLCTNTNQIFKNAREASEVIFGDSSFYRGIRKFCGGKSGCNSYKGFVFQYLN